MSADRETDPTAGLPPDLAALLRDPSIIVPQDAAVFELIAKWMDAPSNTASALTVDEWRDAWVYSTNRFRKAEDALAQLRAERDMAEQVAFAAADASIAEARAERDTLREALGEAHVYVAWFTHPDNAAAADREVAERVLAQARDALAPAPEQAKEEA